jgi:hypothetical protein
VQIKKPPGGRLSMIAVCSALGELLAAPSLVQTHLLSFNFPRVPGNEARLAQNRLERRVVINQGSRYAVSHGTCLSRFPTTIDIDQNVERIQMIGQYQRLAYNHTTGLARKKFINRLVIDNDLAFAGLDEDSRYRTFATARPIVVLDCHEIP